MEEENNINLLIVNDFKRNNFNRWHALGISKVKTTTLCVF